MKATIHFRQKEDVKQVFCIDINNVYQEHLSLMEINWNLAMDRYSHVLVFGM